MKRFVTILTLTLIAASVPVMAAAQTSSSANDHDALLRTLIEEIRALRQTLEKSRIYELRASIMLDQMQARQSSIDKLRQRIIDLRQQISYDNAEELDYYAEEVKQRLNRETDPAQREQIERELEMVEKRRELQDKRRTEIQQQVQQLEIRLREEEGKMLDLEGDLDRLQRSLINEAE